MLFVLYVRNFYFLHCRFDSILFFFVTRKWMHFRRRTAACDWNSRCTCPGHLVDFFYLFYLSFFCNFVTKKSVLNPLPVRTSTFWVHSRAPRWTGDFISAVALVSLDLWSSIIRRRSSRQFLYYSIRVWAWLSLLRWFRLPFVRLRFYCTNVSRSTRILIQFQFHYFDFPWSNSEDRRARGSNCGWSWRGFAIEKQDALWKINKINKINKIGLESQQTKLIIDFVFKYLLCFFYSFFTT